MNQSRNDRVWGGTAKSLCMCCYRLYPPGEQAPRTRALHVGECMCEGCDSLLAALDDSMSIGGEDSTDRRRY